MAHNNKQIEEKGISKKKNKKDSRVTMPHFSSLSAAHTRPGGKKKKKNLF